MTEFTNTLNHSIALQEELNAEKESLRNFHHRKKIEIEELRKTLGRGRHWRGTIFHCYIFSPEA